MTDEKKPRKSSTPTQRLAAIGKRAAKAQANADKGRAKLIKTLHAWGLIGTTSPPETTQELSELAFRALSRGFVPPKSERKARVAAPDSFKEGDEIALLPDFEGAYATVYTAEERGSMVYEFYDEVNKVAVIKTSSPRQMAAKLKHITKKVIDAAPTNG